MSDKAAQSTDEWTIAMAPKRGVLWIVLLSVWAFAAGTYALLKLTDGDIGFLGHVIVFAFPLLISFYALRGIFAENGKLTIGPLGFSRTLPSGGEEFLAWDRIEAFGTQVFGDPVVTGTGAVTAQFVYHDMEGERRIGGLANSLPYAGETLARIMEYARLEAEKGWPTPPSDISGLAGAALSDARTSAPRQLARVC